MDPLATADDVAERLGRDLTLEELSKIDALLRDASANVRRVSTQQFTEGTSTVTLPMRNGRIRLPQRPVLTITSVEDVNGNTLSYTRANEQLRVSFSPLNAWEIEPYRIEPCEVVVEYTHGYPPDDDENSTIPDLIVSVVCSIVARAMGQDPTEAGVVQESIDGYSYSTGAVAAQGPIGMLASEIEICEQFKRPSSPISMSV